MRLIMTSSTNQTDRNFFHLVADILWFGIALAATSRFLSVYAIRLDASPMAQSMIVALPGLVLGLSTFMSGWWRNRFHTTDIAVRLPGLAFRLVFVLLAFAPFFPPEIQVTWLILAVVLPAVPQGVAGTLFLTFMRESVGDSKWDALTSRRFLWLNVGIAAGALGFGALLTRVTFPLNYQIMFMAAFVFSIVSYWHVTKSHSVYPTPKPTDTMEMQMPLMKLPGFARVVASIVIAHLVFLSVNAIIPLALVQRLGAEEGFIAIYGLIELMGGAAMGLFGDRLVHRIGSRRMTAAMLGLTALTPLVTATAPELWITLIGAVATGFGWTGTAMGMLAMLVEATPSYAMPRASARFNQLAAVGIFFGPMIGGLLATSGLNLAWVMMLGVGLRLFGAILIGAEGGTLRPMLYRITHPRLATVTR